MLLVGVVALSFAPGVRQPPAGHVRRTAASPTMVVGQQAESYGPAQLLRKLKADLPQFPWLAEGDGAARNKVDMPDFVQAILAQDTAPKREAESDERTERIRSRFEQAASDARELRGMLVGEEDSKAWWRTPNGVAGGRAVTKEDPLRVIIAGGGLAGLISAAACHAKGMKVAIFEQGEYRPLPPLDAAQPVGGAIRSCTADAHG